ncbi:ATP-dependent helicase HrpB [Solimonas marina]|uniref:ATP-dependent helicase HrpB n=1 Tax=Solimonas marina TaxID=2714601 RepID=A0A969W9Y9_9GAMM|nr:ATP-dependent helicase HrpB [Solimonas marina]NKF22708.1 ATP-dependent helicase HrpB [Solimonas marina]
MRPTLPELPVAQSLPDLRRALRAGSAAVLAAPPGSGKTTLVPLALLDEPWLANQRIVMLEPRRVAARAAARRMASLLSETVGETVGYQIRFERRQSARTRIEVVTEGILARRLQADAELPGVGLLIFDEFHERSLDADLALALALDVRENLNPDLRILVMSATLDSTRVAALLGNAPVVESGGRMFPVDIRHLESGSPPSLREHGDFVARHIICAHAQTHGDILAFLPGGREIGAAERALHDRYDNTVAIRPLHGSLSSEAQDLALQPDAGGRRKIILATNIAQTSLTVEGVDTVVDGGLVRAARFDMAAGANRLETERISRASADQRAGRAGRLGPGVCFRLWNRDQHGGLVAHDIPEILSVDLTRFALDLAAWGIADPAALSFLDLPGAAQWAYAQDRLHEIQAIDAAGRITAHGRALLRLPAAPRVAHMLLTARAAGLGGAAAWVAAALEGRDAHGHADFAQSVQTLASGRGGDPASRQAVESARQFRHIADIDEPARAIDERAIARCIGWAFPERLARRRPGVRGTREIAFLCADGSEARLLEHDALAQQEWLSIAHWEPGPPRRIRAGAALAEADVMTDQAPRIAWHAVVAWDPQRECVVAESQQRLGAIVLRTRALPADEQRALGSPAMLAGIRSIGLHALPWTDAARELQARTGSLRTWRPELELPDFSDDALLASLELWLAPHLHGMTRRDHLARLDLTEVLRAQLDYAQQQALARLAPTHIEVPTGSRIRLDYQPPGAPVLAVKLQEMFGSPHTPTVNDGRVAVTLHLLSPAQRPVAVTADLGGFWAGSYADVRKDLRGRYPRHPWPEDPAHAIPTRRAKPRGT